MKPSTILIGTAALLSGTASANYECWWGGALALTGTVKYHAERACKGYDGKKGAFQGWFAPGESRKVCVNNLAERIAFEVVNENRNQGFDLDDNDCYKEFEELVDKCTRKWQGIGDFTNGGRGSTSGWFFK
ncbi:hypothetical protein Micbo1qcDRAFT_179328 [Microdochium bolleyi]|uniref:Secreted protein n=1 Tax=Microdochium bolleyi TaxID=196109 RepID=A0A136IQ72_9PEZI|nr:hypothetical protein Micbo1qcDRAFT_179328 [Microdochium bolleyi]